MENDSSGPQLLTAAQVAERLAIKESTIRAWLLARRLPFIRVGRRAVRIPIAEVNKILTQGRVPARGKNA
jgi:excisionase family DNA binding protein